MNAMARRSEEDAVDGQVAMALEARACGTHHQTEVKKHIMDGLCYLESSKGISLDEGSSDSKLGLSTTGHLHRRRAYCYDMDFYSLNSLARSGI